MEPRGIELISTLKGTALRFGKIKYTNPPWDGT